MGVRVLTCDDARKTHPRARACPPLLGVGGVVPVITARVGEVGDTGPRVDTFTGYLSFLFPAEPHFVGAGTVVGSVLPPLAPRNRVGFLFTFR